MEKLVENTQKSGDQCMRKISEKFVIEKFTRKNANANLWGEIFEKEVTENDKQI